MLYRFYRGRDDQSEGDAELQYDRLLHRDDEGKSVVWTVICQRCTAVGVRDILVDYRVARGSRSFNKLKSARNRWRVYRDYLKLPLIPSVKAMAGYAINGLKKYR